MRVRKLGQPTLPSFYYRDDILSVPGYTFEKAIPWADTGSMTQLAEGHSLKDGSTVLAKIAPAHSNGSMCLEREAHILEGMAASPEATTTALRFIDFFTIPRPKGDSVVLLVVHPGVNLLSHYLPSSRVNDLLLPDTPRHSKTSTSTGDVFMMGVDEGTPLTEELADVMDLATFLEFAIQATHCVEMIHNLGVVHREVRANAFHLNGHTGRVRFVHFGNRAISLEQFGGPSELLIQSDVLDEMEKLKVKEALCYLAPEQTGSVDVSSEDHRTDLYSLGILFWTLLVGRGVLPFEGSPMEVLYSIVQKRSMPVHEVRRDVPQVLATIIDKLLAKSPEDRYQSSYGVKADLIECQRLLLAAVSSGSGADIISTSELIPSFPIGGQDRYMHFTLPSVLFGREKELEIIGDVIRQVSLSYSRQLGATHSITLSASTSPGPEQSGGAGASEDYDDSSDRSEASTSLVQTPLSVEIAGSPVLATTRVSPMSDATTSASTAAMSSVAGDGLRRAALASTKTRAGRVHAIIIQGLPGAGKSSLILANQAKWRSHGLWGQAKFQRSVSAPFAALMACLSSVLRQLMVFNSDLHRFVAMLRSQLGPQMQNVPLLYQGAPELRGILRLFGVELDSPNEGLAPSELRARFQSLVVDVFAVLAQTRLFALFLDDLHEADESSLDLIHTLANSKCRMIVFTTVRTNSEFAKKVRAVFTSKTRSTWIELEPLGFPAVASIVSRALHRSKDDCAPLSRLVHSVSRGNAFSARSFLTTIQRQNLITYDWDRNHWIFDFGAVEKSLVAHKATADPSDPQFLLAQLRQLPEDARRYLIWASFFGATFKVTEVAFMMHWDDSSGGGSGDDEMDDMNLSRAVSAMRENNGHGHGRESMRGLHIAIQEGWLVQRARDMCSFAHDRYRQAAQAEAAALPDGSTARMSFRIILMMLHDGAPDVHRVAEHARRCIPLLREHPKREELLQLLMDAGDSAWARGAHEIALDTLINVRALIGDGEEAWEKDAARAFPVCLKLAELFSWKVNYEQSNALIEEAFQHSQTIEDKARLLRIRSRNHWACNNFSSALQDILEALRILGVDVNATPTTREADTMFEQVKNEILAVGFDDIMSLPRATGPTTDLITSLLNDAATNSYWSLDPGSLTDIIGLTTIRLALRSGVSPGTCLGFFWALGAAAERRELYRFSVDLARLGLRIATKYGGSFERCRALYLFVSLASPYDNVHLRINVTRLDDAVKFGHTAGDRSYTAFASIHRIMARLFICDHISEILVSAEEMTNDVKLWVPDGGPLVLATSLLNCIRALGGYTLASSPETVYDTSTYKEAEYLKTLKQTSADVPLAMSWYNGFKVVALFCLGFVEEAAELGFGVYNLRHLHPNHRHVRYAAFFHSLALIDQLRRPSLPDDQRTRYMTQIDANQTLIRKWLSPSPVNTSTWVALVDAELASLINAPEAHKLYDIAVKLAVNYDWILEEGWALYLQGCHFVRCGVEGLGSELQRRGIARQSQWGAQGVANHLAAVIGAGTNYPLKRSMFTADVGTQTDHSSITFAAQQTSFEETTPYPTNNAEDDEYSTLTASDLASILKWSKEVSKDINLSSALQRLTEIAADTSGAQRVSVVIAREIGDYTVATTMMPPDICRIYDTHKPIRTLNDPLQQAVIQHTLNSKDRLYYEDAAVDSRFSSEAAQSLHRSVISLPIFSNRGQTFGAVYLASKYAFSQKTLTILTLLCQQASISVANALLFRSVQAGTRENLKMIATQKEALEDARRSREEAEKATKIKSNFLASMSHELRTPFSSFYGLLDILDGTELNLGQREIVQTAKQSCELLLKIIDSILDYSKLEASAVKLEFTGFPVENIIADCMELLLPMAARKLDLSFNIEPDVPFWVKSDYARIRQVLMNLIGNAVKFTPSGSVRVTCALDKADRSVPGEVRLKFIIKDTGIGLSNSDVELLFTPFQQADNSSTRRFGGTGLGLSISRQLVMLMGGAIGVESLLGVGSMFWFSIPVKLFESEESKKSIEEIDTLQRQLMKPRPPRLLVVSPSEATRALLGTMLSGFFVTCVSSLAEANALLREVYSPTSPLDFVLLDDQSETHADDLAHQLKDLESGASKDTKIIHLYTPTTNSLSGLALFSSTTPGVTKMTKPPRKARLLHTLATLLNLPSALPKVPVTDVGTAIDDLGAARRTLYGNVLIAEDNPVAQKLLIKQLERYQLKCIATNNGAEAVAEWQAHEPGFFSVALFDHHMPICDGVEAAKRIRSQENQRKIQNLLPIVALSADAQESTKALCLSNGFNAFFSKPLKKSDLFSLMSMFGSDPPDPFASPETH